MTSPTAVTAVLVALIAAGVVTAVQGVLFLRGKGNPRPYFYERPLMDVVSPKNKRQAQLALGRVRLIYGIFLVVVGVWGLTL